MLLREHDVGNLEEETINGKHTAKVLSDNWGFYYTVTMNLKKVKEYQTSVLSEEDRKDISKKIDKLLELIEKEPKSGRWKRRAKAGIKKKWYTEVASKRI